MKTLILAAAIFVTSHGKQIKLTNEQYRSLQTYSTNNVKATLAACDKGCDIRNNEAADQIFKFLGK